MRLARVLLLLGLSVWGSGCALIDDSCHNFTVAFSNPVESCRENSRNRNWAECTWEQVKTTPSGSQRSPDYAQGFKDGFAEYLFRGGDGHPPLVAPQCYRDIRFQNPQGYMAIQDWFAGYRHGAALARDSGARKWITGPSSMGVGFEDPTAQFALPFNHEAPIQLQQSPVRMEPLPVPQVQPPIKHQQLPVQQEQPPIKHQQLPVQQEQPPVKLEQPPAKLEQPPAKLQQLPIKIDRAQQSASQWPKLHVVPVPVAEAAILTNEKANTALIRTDMGWPRVRWKQALYESGTDSEPLPEALKIRILAISSAMPSATASEAPQDELIRARILGGRTAPLGRPVPVQNAVPPTQDLQQPTGNDDALAPIRANIISVTTVPTKE